MGTSSNSFLGKNECKVKFESLNIWSCLFSPFTWWIVWLGREFYVENNFHSSHFWRYCSIVLSVFSATAVSELFVYGLFSPLCKFLIVLSVVFPICTLYSGHLGFNPGTWVILDPFFVFSSPCAFSFWNEYSSLLLCIFVVFLFSGIFFNFIFDLYSFCFAILCLISRAFFVFWLSFL